jgi:hypothetical protein
MAFSVIGPPFPIARPGYQFVGAAGRAAGTLPPSRRWRSASPDMENLDVGPYATTSRIDLRVVCFEVGCRQTASADEMARIDPKPFSAE